MCLAVALLAAWSLVKPDPLRLAAGARSKPQPAEEPPEKPAEISAPAVAAEPRAS